MFGICQVPNDECEVTWKENTKLCIGRNRISNHKIYLCPFLLNISHADMTFDPEFKKALQLLPEKEKDKLILRLLKRDLQLANRLQFELVETDSVQDKRE